MNFAVFTAEIDNLEIGTPITMLEFYESTNPYEVLLNWLFENYNRKSENIIAHDALYGDYLYQIAYDSKNDYMCVLVDFSEATIILDISHDPSKYYYYYKYNGEYDYWIASGEINAYNYTMASPLEKFVFSGAIYADSEQAEHLTKLGVSLSVVLFRNILLLNPEIGLTIEDFGFTSFK